MGILSSKYVLAWSLSGANLFLLLPKVFISPLSSSESEKFSSAVDKWNNKWIFVLVKLQNYINFLTLIITAQYTCTYANYLKRSDFFKHLAVKKKTAKKRFLKTFKNFSKRFKIHHLSTFSDAIIRWSSYSTSTLFFPTLYSTFFPLDNHLYVRMSKSLF